MTRRIQLCMNPSHSTNEPDDSHSATYISVRFVSLLPAQIPIEYQYTEQTAMKQFESNPSAPGFPSLFQIAAFFEDFFPAHGFNRSVSRLKHLPFAELMSSPDRLMAALKSGKPEEAAAERPKAKPSTAPRRTSRGTTPKRGDTGGGENTPENQNQNPTPNRSPEPEPRESLKKVEFVLEAPAANSVKLAADFTDWEKSPLEMQHAADGRWSAVVPLAPGQYSYRFIVDGQWFDDPSNTRHAPNPFGTENAVVTVA